MKSLLKRIWGHIRKWWWAVLGGGLLVLSWFFLKPRKKPVVTRADLLKKRNPNGTLESLRHLTVMESERAQTDVLIEKAKADTKVEAKHEQLDRIQKESDPVARRRRLAEWGERNL